MRVKVYVNHIFPAYLYLHDRTGEILQEPALIEESLINKLLDWWLFDMIALLTNAILVWNGQEPNFVLRLSRKDHLKLQSMGLLHKHIWGNL